MQESEWLRVALKQWLDDEYCPEPANEDISSRCGKVYYRCLLEGVDDIGDILIEFVSLENQKASFASFAALYSIVRRQEHRPLLFTSFTVKKGQLSGMYLHLG